VEIKTRVKRPAQGLENFRAPGLFAGQSKFLGNGGGASAGTPGFGNQAAFFFGWDIDFPRGGGREHLSGAPLWNRIGGGHFWPCWAISVTSFKGAAQAHGCEGLTRMRGRGGTAFFDPFERNLSKLARVLMLLPAPQGFFLQRGKTGVFPGVGGA